jgi:molybdenum cofactor biosynthesis protein B
MSDPVREHRTAGPARLGVTVLTVSDTRTEKTDTSGRWIVEALERAGHEVKARAIVPDEPDEMRPLFEAWRDRLDIDVVLVTGGTGIAPRDRTVDTVETLLTTRLPGFGELFRMLSHAEIGPAAMLSRATGGLMGQTAVFVMPGSTAAVRLAMEKILLPELPHMVGLLRRV